MFDEENVKWSKALRKGMYRLVDCKGFESFTQEKLLITKTGEILNEKNFVLHAVVSLFIFSANGKIDKMQELKPKK